MTILSSLRAAARRFGLEVERSSPMTHWHMRLPALLKHHKIDTVIDIGGNDGGFASELLKSGYTGRVVSFEPKPDAWERLRARDGLQWPLDRRAADRAERSGWRG